MNPKPLFGCYLQTKWAKAEIDKVQVDIRKFLGGATYEIRSKVDVQAGEEVWRFHVTKKVPPKITLRVGNILANLRDPLDNVLAILSDQLRGKTSGVAFPFESDMDKYDSRLREVEKLLPAGAGEIIRKAETYPGGNAHLRALNFLNRDKKHRLPISPFNLRTSTLAQALGVFKGGKLIRIGFKNGQHLFPVPPNYNLAYPANPAQHPTFIANRGFVFEPGPGDDEMEFLTTTPGTKFQGVFKPSLDVAFTKTPGIEREPIGIALHQMRQLVDGILLAFEKRFFT